MLRPRTAALALAAVAVCAVAVVGATALVGPAEVPGAAQADSTAGAPTNSGLSTTAGAPANFGAPTGPETPPSESLVRPGGDGSLLWPYTSKRRSVEGRTLAINVVVHGDRDAVRRSLTDRGDRGWNRTPANESEARADTHAVVVDDGGIAWSAARGSTRYSYVVSGNASEVATGEGRWVTPDYQVHAGSYLGTRHHLRAYESPRAGDRWTAFQAHAEYWDWFRLRHTVTRVKGAAVAVESEYLGEPYVSEVRREYRGNRGGGNDGWITAIELALAAIAVGASVTRGLPDAAERVRERVGTAVAADRGTVVLPAAMLALYLGVRAGGVGLERAFPGTSPKVFAGLLYPVVAVGLPLAAARASRPLDAVAAFALAVTGLGAAFVLDFSTLGLVSLPVRLVLHRVALLVSLGLVAAGCARADGPPDRRALALGAAGWVVCLLLPLFGVL